MHEAEGAVTREGACPGTGGFLYKQTQKAEVYVCRGEQDMVTRATW